MVLDEDNLNHFESHLNHLKRLDLYRRLRINDDFDKINDSDNRPKFIDFSSNDYLGLSKDKNLLNLFKSLNPSRISQCSSRLITGNTNVLERLEKSLSVHRDTEVALVYPTGYMANLGVISSISDNETTIFSDELNHASIIDSCRLSKAKVEIFSHNNIIELEDKIRSDKSKRRMIVTEGIFSMNGDMAKLDRISQLSKEFGCILIVDDAHGDFIIGDRSKLEHSGTPSFFGVENDVDIHISSMSKGLGCFGGYVACSDIIRNYLINKSRAFIFTSALPDVICELAYHSITLAREGHRQEKLQENLEFFSDMVQKYSLSALKITKYSPIIPLVVGPEAKTLSISTALLAKGY